MKTRTRCFNSKTTHKRDNAPHITEYSYLLAEMTPQDRETALNDCTPEVRAALIQDLKALGAETPAKR